MLLAQISDLHLQSGRRPASGIVDTAGALEACVAHLNALDPRPDVLLATGDLTHDGTAESYALLREILAALKMPVHLIPGNHDDREELRRAFAAPVVPSRDGEWIQYAVEDYPLRLLGLDTVVPGSPAGALCDGRLRWLAARLDEQPTRPTVLFLHHPPFLTGIRHMDGMNLRTGAAELGALVQRHPQVERLLCGHVHRPVQVRWHGTLASIAPSPSHQVYLDLQPESPARFALEPAACQLHLWEPTQGLISHLSYVGRYSGPHPF